MNLVIDVGNTRTKLGIFEEATLQRVLVFADREEARNAVNALSIDHAILSSVAQEDDAVVSRKNVTGQLITLVSGLSLPIQNLYETPATLGTDRLAAACGAWQLFPHQASLVVDCGTCINYEFISEEGQYKGGAISPGLTMRFRSMHEQTSRLPLANPVEEAPLTGASTRQCLQSGVMNGALEEIKGIMARYRKENPGIRVILTGGDSRFFEKPLKPFIFVAPELVLTGLNSILLHHVHP